MQFTSFITLAVAFAGLSSAAAVIKRQSYSGDATFYAPGLGSCGQMSAATDLIAAIPNTAALPMGWGSPNCGRKAVVNRGDGRTVTVTLLDTCGRCAEGDIDLSPSAFDKIATEAEGRVKVTWNLI